MLAGNETEPAPGIAARQAGARHFAVKALPTGIGTWMLMIRFWAPPMMVSPPRISTGAGPTVASTLGTVWAAAS
jgi:hypothetical protein